MNYYLVTTGSHTHGCNHFFTSWASIDVSGASLLSVRFDSQDSQDLFESMAGVIPIPATGSITAEILTKLQALGLPASTSALTLKDIRRIAKAHYKAML